MTSLRSVSNGALSAQGQATASAGLDASLVVAALTIRPNAVGRLPGPLNLLLLPFDLIYTASALIKAKSLGDTEGELDATLRLSTLPLNALSSISSVITALFQLGTFASYVRVTLSSIHFSPNFLASMNIVGLILCAVETVIEALAVDRQVNFLSKFHLNSVEKIDNDLKEIDPKKKRKLLAQSCSHLCHKKGLSLSSDLIAKLKRLELMLLFAGSADTEILSQAESALHEASKQILQTDAESLQEKYLIITSAEKQKIENLAKRRFPKAPPEKIAKEIANSSLEILKVKSNNLARRVEPWCAQELSSKLAFLLKNMQSSDPTLREKATTEVKEILSLTKIQAKKYLIYHIVSLCVFIASAAVFIALLASCPPLIPVFFLGAIGLVSSISYILYTGSINQKGWKFSASDCIPSPIKYVYRKINQFYEAHAKPMKDRVVTHVTSSAGLKRSYQAI